MCCVCCGIHAKKCLANLLSKRSFAFLPALQDDFDRADEDVAAKMPQYREQLARLAHPTTPRPALASPDPASHLLSEGGVTIKRHAEGSLTIPTAGIKRVLLWEY